MLQYKIYLYIGFCLGRHGKEGLRELTINSFEINASPEGRCYIKMIHKETTKKSQGHEPMNSKNLYKDDNNKLIVEQPGNPRCPVASFEKYLARIDHSIDVLFQQPKKNIHLKDTEIWYHKKVVRKETISTWLKTISTESKCSQIYTNHCLRKTTANSMKKSRKNYSIPTIASVLGHHNYQSLESYVEEPDDEERIDFCDSLFDYTGANENEESSLNNADDFNPPSPPKKKLKLQRKKKENPTSTATAPNPNGTKIPTVNEADNIDGVMNEQGDQNVENMDPAEENQMQIVPLEPNFNEINENLEMSIKLPKENNTRMEQINQMNTNMTMSKIPNIFGNSTFNNCTINFQMPQ